LAVRSLVQENPTIDEVAHLPAGITYWQKGTFKLYPHNPPLVKLVAAWPVSGPGTGMQDCYSSIYWKTANKAGMAHLFAEENAGQYFELFTRARLLMPIFSVIGGLFVFLWSRHLYGAWGGLLSLAIWVLCPNILAHSRLITTDVGATALGFAATYLFWLYLQKPTWLRASAAGVALGLAELSKYSMLLLYALWPLMWLIREGFHFQRAGLARRYLRALGQGLAVVAISVVVIDAGYGFEGVFRPLGRFRFVSASLSRERDRPMIQQPRPEELLARIAEYRVNRFEGTWLGGLPVPLPRYYVTGFDEQKLEADGVWARFIPPPEIGDRMPPEEANVIHGYPVYLDGTLRDKSWPDYYLRALLYKTPEGTWGLLALSFIILVASRRSRSPWADEVALLLLPVTLLGYMSLGTNINLGLRYVLPIFPYLFTSAGKLARWASGLQGTARAAAISAIVLCVGETAVATASIHPHYLAYFNWASGGPAKGSKHLIDSNLDWGQDLVNLKRWLDRNAPGEKVGLAYFGQIHPNIFARRGEPLNWDLPPALPNTMKFPPPKQFLAGTNLRPEPGLYAVSASLVRGLDWRVYTPHSRANWEAGRRAFIYFKELEPFDTIGYSIFLYRITPEQSDRLAQYWQRPREQPRGAGP
jgi:hypothetical protein